MLPSYVMALGANSVNTVIHLFVIAQMFVLYSEHVLGLFFFFLTVALRLFLDSRGRLDLTHHRPCMAHEPQVAHHYIVVNVT